MVQEYNLPSGVIARTRKPLNKDRRALLNSENVNPRLLIELLLAECMLELVFPKGHELHPEGKTIVFKELDKDKWSRLDDLDLPDSMSLTESFGLNNWPDQQMIDSVVKANQIKKD